MFSQVAVQLLRGGRGRRMRTKGRENKDDGPPRARNRAQSPGVGETGRCGRLLDCAATGHTVCSRTQIAQDVRRSPPPRSLCRAEQREVWQCLHVREAGGAVGKHRTVWDVGAGGPWRGCQD